MTPGFIRANLRTRRALASLGVITAFLFAVTLSAAAHTHERIHPDAAKANHECVVTILASGSNHQADAPPLVSAPLPAIRFPKIVALTPVFAASVFLGACIFEHAPPALL